MDFLGRSRAIFCFLLARHTFPEMNGSVMRLHGRWGEERRGRENSEGSAGMMGVGVILLPRHRKGKRRV